MERRRFFKALGALVTAPVVAKAVELDESPKDELVTSVDMAVGKDSTLFIHTSADPDTDNVKITGIAKKGEEGVRWDVPDPDASPARDLEKLRVKWAQEAGEDIQAMDGMGGPFSWKREYAPVDMVNTTGDVIKEGTPVFFDGDNWLPCEGEIPHGYDLGIVPFDIDEDRVGAVVRTVGWEEIPVDPSVDVFEGKRYLVGVDGNRAVFIPEDE